MFLHQYQTRNILDGASIRRPPDPKTDTSIKLQYTSFIAQGSLGGFYTASDGIETNERSREGWIASGEISTRIPSRNRDNNDQASRAECETQSKALERSIRVAQAYSWLSTAPKHKSAKLHEISWLMTKNAHTRSQCRRISLRKPSVSIGRGHTMRVSRIPVEQGNGSRTFRFQKLEKRLHRLE
ncbi:unnamed protein product [Nesidiocoris tenuis]|uniref:Uncharacterized protein n=1 Tax=Nesidiocoris tenuis TaxID=355587 RepID=A0A6H5G735_9HEMI|nr:unnamed protein product [Nesidiocoris tenuis]